MTDIVTDILGLAQETSKAIDRGSVKAAPAPCPCDEHAQGSLPPIPSLSQDRSAALPTGIDRSIISIAPDAISALITSSAAETVVAIEQGRVSASPEICPCPDHSGGATPVQAVNSYSPETSTPVRGPLDRQLATGDPSQLSLTPDSIISMITESATETVKAIDSGRILNSPEICPCPDHAGVVETKNNGTRDGLSSGIENNRVPNQGDDKINRDSDSKTVNLVSDSRHSVETPNNDARHIEGRPEPAFGVNEAKQSENRSLEVHVPAAIVAEVTRSDYSSNLLTQRSPAETREMSAVERVDNSASLNKSNLRRDSSQGPDSLPRGLISQQEYSAAHNGQELRPTGQNINRAPTGGPQDQASSTILVSKPNSSPGSYQSARQSVFETPGLREPNKQVANAFRAGKELRVSPPTQGAGRDSIRQVLGQLPTRGDGLSPLRSTLRIPLTRQMLRDVTRVGRLANKLDSSSTRTISLRKVSVLLRNLEKSKLYKSQLVNSRGLKELLREARRTIRAAEQTKGNLRLSQSFKRSLEPLLKRIASRLRTQLKKQVAKDASFSIRIKLRNRASMRLARRGARQGPSRSGEIGQSGIKRVPVRIRVRVMAERKAVSKPNVERRSADKRKQSASEGIQQRAGRIKLRAASQRKPPGRPRTDYSKGEPLTEKNSLLRFKRQNNTEHRLVQPSRRAKIVKLKRVEEEIKRLADIRRSLLISIKKSRLSSARKTKEETDFQSTKTSRARRKSRRFIFDESLEDQVVQDFEAMKILDPVEAAFEAQQQIDPQAEEQTKMFVSAANDGPKNELSTVQAKELDSSDDVQGDAESHEASESDLQAAYH